MIKMVKNLVLAILLILPVGVYAQQDSIWLKCPLEDAIVVPPPKNVMKFDEPDLCIVLVSIPDTVVKAVFYYRDYYFWYSGLSKVLVRRGDNVKTGQPLGNIPLGGSLEFLMYNFETPMDPIRFLECKKVLKTE